MSDGLKQGVWAAMQHAGVDDAAQALVPPVPSAEQLDFLDDARLDALLPIAPVGTSGPKGGRPRGSMNKRTAEMREYLLKRYGNPLESLAALASRPTVQLVQELQAIAKEHDIKLGGTLIDVMRLQISCLEGLAPYVAQKMPTALEVDQRTANMLVIGSLSPNVGDGAALLDLGIPLTAEQIVENQQLSKSADEKSDGEKSDDMS